MTWLEKIRAKVGYLSICPPVCPEKLRLMVIIVCLDANDSFAHNSFSFFVRYHSDSVLVLVFMIKQRNDQKMVPISLLSRHAFYNSKC